MHRSDPPATPPREQVDVHLHVHLPDGVVESLSLLPAMSRALSTLTRKASSIMATQSELAAQLRAMKEQNDKATAEQQAALQKVVDELANAGVTSPEVDAALADLKASIQRDDDLNPDAPGTGGDGGAP